MDGGAYIGDTICEFLKKYKEFNKIIAFEPDGRNYELLEKKYGSNRKIQLVKSGLYKKNGELYFLEAASGSHMVENKEQSTTTIRVSAIDEMPECGDATFIKMDIEGAEMDALEGAKQTILRNHPKLAICIYHSNEDMIRIIEYIHELVPEYKLYVRHYTSWNNETVLYAVI